MMNPEIHITTVEELYEKLIQTIRERHLDEDISMVEKAYQVASKAHGQQVRKSGEPYIIHPLSVAVILANLEMDQETITAGILHDVVEDTVLSYDDVAEMFSPEVAELVDGVTKLTKLKYTSDKVEIQAENLRKMFLAMAKDIRVIIIKLADRLHNMRTLQYMTRYKQIEKARETMEIYSPIAQRLGISKLKIELDDLALKYTEPDVYLDLYQNVEKIKSSQDSFVNKMVAEIRGQMEQAHIDCEVDGRVKHLFSIYRKMKNQNKTLDQVYDLFAIRIKVDSIKDCYAALGVIHEEYKPVPGRFKDYIAMPKQNMYQSLHTTLISGSGQPFEVQIRTFEMHRVAEYGIAAHWKYKEGKGADDKTITRSEEEKLSWLRRILDMQQEMSDNREYMELLKDDLNLFSDYVYCFTPQGDVKSLPAGATPIDFAYSIHSAVGNRMIGARVNGKIVNIDYQLKNGDRVEVITSQNSKGPSLDWLNIVKSSQAKTKINQWFRTSQKDENVQRGRELLDKYMKIKGINEQGIFAAEYENVVAFKYGFKEWTALLAAVGHGGMKEGQVVNRLLDEYYKKNKKAEMTDADVLHAASEAAKPEEISKHHGAIVVKGLHDVAVRFSKCCSPVPGDEIVGFVTRGRGVTIHRTDCVNIINLNAMDRVRLIDAQWDRQAAGGSSEKYAVEITMYATNRVGMLVDISKVLSARDIDVTSMNSRINKQGTATISMGFEISSREELEQIVEKLRGISGCIDIIRSNNS